MTLSSHQLPHRGKSDDWLTPPSIIKALGPFDLDPCASVHQPWRTATVQYTIEDDGLSQEWPSDFFTFVNPPFGPEAGKWLLRLAEHRNGIGLVPARTETKWFVEHVWKRADAILFLWNRPYFHYPNGERGKSNSGAPICLIAYGQLACLRLQTPYLKGSYVNTWIFPRNC